MKKKLVIYLFIAICCIFALTGCESNNNISGNNSSDTNYPKLDHKIYKYMKVSSDINSSIMYNIDHLFGNVFYVCDYNEETGKDDYYYTTLLLEFDTNTGHCNKSTLYLFFNGEGQEALNHFNKQSESAKKDFSNVTLEKINKDVSYIKADVNPESYNFGQYISTYLIHKQDIDKYKDQIFYSRLDNYYDPKPEAKSGDNFFQEPLESTRIEWSDKEIKPF